MTSKTKLGQPGLLKKMNRSLIIELIFKHKEISRSELAKKTGLALPSVMRLIDGLIQDQVVVDIGKGDSSGGRKPSLLSLNRTLMYIVGVEIAVKTTVILTNLLGEIIDEWSTDEMQSGSPQLILEKVVSNIDLLLDKHNIDKSELGGIGIGTPGMNFKYVRDVDYSILRGWESTDVKNYFEKHFDCDIIVENVARTRTLAELWFGHGQEIDDFIYVFVDQGVGCGIVQRGKILIGHDAVAGEFGHHIISYGGKPCYCGNEGCIEMYVSAGAITSHFSQVVHSFSDVLELDSSQTSQLLTETGTILGVGISNLINIFNPRSIILGGIVPMKSELVFNAAKEKITSSIFSNYALETNILRSSIEQEGLGSIALVINRLFKEA